ncbi:MAG: hypothetical protein IT204_07285 [Fimbriimonadaceae bacterium]|nr:hypothetical protein [Fimbriimonadaceae bacterium]
MILRRGLLVLLLAVTAGQGVDLTGRVRLVGGSGGSPGGLRVVVTPLAGGAASSSTTDAAGRFTARHLEPGLYELRAAAGAAQARVVWGVREGGGPLELRLATPLALGLLSLLWSLTALVVTVASGAGIVLYGRARSRWQSSLPRSVSAALLCWIAGFELLRLLSPDMLPYATELAQGLSGVCAALLTGCLAVVLVELQPSPWAAAGAFGAGLLLALAGQRLGAHHAGPLATAVGLVLWTTAAGWLLALRLRRPSYIVLTALVVAIADYWSVFGGVTGHVMSSDSSAAQSYAAVATLPWPVFGTNLVPGLVGAADFLFLALFLGAALRFGWGVGRNYWALMAAFTIGLTLAQTLAAAGALEVGLPALPFLSVMFLLVNRGRYQLDAADRRRIATLTGLLLLGAVLHLGLRQAGQPAAEEHVVTTHGDGPEAAPADWELPPAAALHASGRGERLVVHGAAPGSTLRLPPTATAAVVLLARQATIPSSAALLAASPDRARLAVLTLPVLPPADGVAVRAALRVTPQPQASLLYQTAAWTRGALDLLQQRCPGRPLAILAEGLAGLPALAVAAHDSRVRAVAISGLGTVGPDDGQVGQALAAATAPSRQRWLAAFDPVARIAAYRGPLWLGGGLNDPLFSAPAQWALRAAAGRGPQLWAPGERLAVAAAAPWLRALWSAQPPRLPTLRASVSGDRLRLEVRGTAPPLAGALYLARGGAPWPGRDWTTVPLRRGPSWPVAVVRIAAPAGPLWAIASVGDGAGGWLSTAATELDPPALGLALAPPVWPEPDLLAGPARPTREPAGSSASPAALPLPAAPGGPDAAAGTVPAGAAGGGPPTWQTRRLDALRQLAPAAFGLQVRFQAPAAGTLTLTLSERAGQADRVDYRATLPAAAGQSLERALPWRAFRAADPTRRPRWEEVDLLTAHWSGGQPLRLEQLRLVGTPGGAVQEVGLP